MSNSDYSKILAIFNGRNFQNKNVDSILKLLNSRAIDHVFTSKKDHITEIIQSKNQYEGYLIFGGDGSIHEAINQFAGTEKWVSFFPGGTVNCIAGFFKIKRSVGYIQSFLANNKTHSFDLIKVDFKTQDSAFTRYVIGFITIGHLADMTIEAERLRWINRIIRYPLVGIKSFFSRNKIKADIHYNSHNCNSKTVTSIIINNCSAERFSSLPTSDYNDGKIEFLIENNSVMGQIASVYSQFFSLYRKNKWISTNQPLSVKFYKPVPVMADGEIYHNIVQMDMTICPSSLNVKL